MKASQPAAALALILALVGFASLPDARAASPAEDFQAFTAGSAKAVDHAAWTALLSKYVVPGADGINRVAYARFRAEGRAALDAYLKALQAEDPAALDRPEQFAFWANLYNAKTIAIVLDHLPVASIKDISLGGGLLAAVTGGPWKAKVLKVMGHDLSLDDIEHGILRPVFKDPRVHYAVNCASLGCPNLGREAFTGARLDEQLDAAARAFINHPRGVAVEDGAAMASSIYSWFQDDFGGNESGLLAHLRRYAEPALKSKLNGITAISEYRYNWSLNDAGAPAP